MTFVGPAGAERAEAAGGLMVHVVHEPSLVERRAALEPALRELGWAVQWTEAPRPGVVGWLRHLPHPRLGRGELGAYLGHVAVLRKIAAGTATALVLEDDALLDGDARIEGDAQLAEDFGATLRRYVDRAPADWDLLFLGASCGLEAEPLATHAEFGGETRTRSMSGFVIRPSTAGALVRELGRRPIRRPIDHTVNEILVGAGLRVYWSVPALIGNGSETGRFPRAVERGRWRAHPMVRAGIRMMGGRTG